MANRFDLERFVIDVFDPVPGETVAVLVDLPTPSVPDKPAWQERRKMAAAWRDGIETLGRRIGFDTLPLVGYPATGRSGADLPAEAAIAGRPASLRDILDRASLLLALTEFSPTAALVDVCKRRPGADVFRAASMPGVEKRMEETSLAADYAEVARRCRLLKEAFQATERAEVEFSTGHRAAFDFRHRVCEADDGYLHRDKIDDIPVINLPSGETFVVPYESEKPGDPSGTEGDLPVAEGAENVVFQVKANRIVAVKGDGPAAASYRAFFEADPARANIAELAFGCNERAVVTGNVLEDEKAGFHWAYGRSDHLGGVTGLAAFKSPDTVVHQDIVYAKTSPISVRKADLIAADGRRTGIIRDGSYILW